MALTEHPSIQGVLTLELRDPHGALLERRRVHNLITTSGKAVLARMLGGKTNGAVQLAIGVGEEPRAPAAGDAKLGRKLTEAKAEMSEPLVAGDQVTVTVKATVVDGGAPDKPLPLTEAGIIVRIGNDPAELLFNRVVFPVINKGANMSLLLSWDLTF